MPEIIFGDVIVIKLLLGLGVILIGVATRVEAAVGNPKESKVPLSPQINPVLALNK